MSEYPKSVLNKLGKRFGYCVVLDALPPIKRKGKSSVYYVICQCDCGKQFKKLARSLNESCKSSCGCMRSMIMQEVRNNNGSALKPESPDNSDITVRLHAKYYCGYTSDKCIKSETVGLCCRECPIAD